MDLDLRFRRSRAAVGVIGDGVLVGFPDGVQGHIARRGVAPRSPAGRVGAGRPAFEGIACARRHGQGHRRGRGAAVPLGVQRCRRVGRVAGPRGVSRAAAVLLRVPVLEAVAGGPSRRQAGGAHAAAVGIQRHRKAARGGVGPRRLLAAQSQGHVVSLDLRFRRARAAVGVIADRIFPGVIVLADEAAIPGVIEALLFAVVRDIDPFAHLLVGRIIHRNNCSKILSRSVIRLRRIRIPILIREAFAGHPGPGAFFCGVARADIIGIAAPVCQKGDDRALFFRRGDCHQVTALAFADRFCRLP